MLSEILTHFMLGKRWDKSSVNAAVLCGGDRRKLLCFQYFKWKRGGLGDYRPVTQAKDRAAVIRYST